MTLAIFVWYLGQYVNLNATRGTQTFNRSFHDTEVTAGTRMPVLIMCHLLWSLFVIGGKVLKTAQLS